MSNLFRNQRVVVAVCYLCAMIMNSLDATIVNVALATLSREFNVDPAHIQAVVIGYLVSLAMCIPISGWLGDRFGTKRTFLVALFIFTSASMLCGIAQSLDQLVAARVLQGAGGGLLTPVGMSMLYRTFPPSERVRISRILMIATVMGPALGPVIGGLLIEHASWRWAFYVNVPVGLAALTIGTLLLHESKEDDAGGFDLKGFILGSIGFATFMFAITEGPNRGWLDPLILGTGLLGMVLIVTFVLVELRTREPMLQLRLLENRLFRSMLLTSFFASGAFLGVLFLFPLYMQEARGLSPLESGLATFPEAVGVLVSSQIAARLYPFVGPRRLMVYGIVVVAATALMLGTMPLHTNIWLVRLVMFVLGFGMANIFISNQIAAMATITRAQTGRASTIMNMQRQVGSSFGIATVSTMLAAIGATQIVNGLEVPNLDGYRTGFAIAAGLALVSGVFAWRVPDEDAAETMARAQ